MADLAAGAATIRTADGIADEVSGSAAPPDSAVAAGMTRARRDDLEPVRIGVTGHRVLAETERVDAGIEAAITRIAGSHPGRPLVVISALAEGLCTDAQVVVWDLASRRRRLQPDRLNVHRSPAWPGSSGSVRRPSWSN
jgi:hypothetical protein